MGKFLFPHFLVYSICILHHLYPLLSTHLKSHVFQFVFLYFTTSCHWVFINKKYILGYFIARYFPSTKFAYIFFFQGLPFFQNDKCSYFFAVFLRWNRRNLNIFYLGHFIQKF